MAGAIPVVRAGGSAPAPLWALLQRRLLAVMGEAAAAFVDRYCRSDGTLIWRQAWPGMDGSDDGYEAFFNFPLLYALGGEGRLLELARRQWEAMTWQFSAYGQIDREFDAYYDWMHHGESNQLLYYLSLADPSPLQERARASRFAAMYEGRDPLACNYDPVHRLMRSPITGSRGPRLVMTAEDWSTHRAVLAAYPPPFEDIPGVTGPTADWTDDATFAAILERINGRMASGDVPLNLTATGLAAHAHLHDGDPVHRHWISSYLQAWADRARENGGILPDNVGPSGRIGERFGGHWWGGYYGWRWPHGGWVMQEAAVNAGCNALLTSGDDSALELARGQLDRLWELGRDERGVRLVPNRHLDAGWTDFRPADARLPILIWNATGAAADRARIERIPGQTAWDRLAGHVGKGDQAHTLPWYRYITGHRPDYPEAILRFAEAQVAARLAAIAADDGDPETWDVHHFQDHNPVICEGLVQTMLGCPAPLYHGGLLHAPVRYFDNTAGRPGLPRDVAALVEARDAAGVTIRLHNLDPLRGTSLIIQGGAFGEHVLDGATPVDAGGEPTGPETPGDGGPWVQVDLAPAAAIRLRLGQRRYARQGAYGAPWDPPGPRERLLQGRVEPPDGPLAH